MALFPRVRKYAMNRFSKLTSITRQVLTIFQYIKSDPVMGCRSECTMQQKRHKQVKHWLLCTQNKDLETDWRGPSEVRWFARKWWSG